MQNFAVQVMPTFRGDVEFDARERGYGLGFFDITVSRALERTRFRQPIPKIAGEEDYAEILERYAAAPHSTGLSVAQPKANAEVNTIMPQYNAHPLVLKRYIQAHKRGGVFRVVQWLVGAIPKEEHARDNLAQLVEESLISTISYLRSEDEARIPIPGINLSFVENALRDLLPFEDDALRINVSSMIVDDLMDQLEDGSGLLIDGGATVIRHNDGLLALIEENAKPRTQVVDSQHEFVF